MSENSMSPESMAARNAQGATELAEAAQRLNELSREKILEAAKLEGWSDSQAEWLDVLAKETLFDDVVAGKDTELALVDAYRLARRRLTLGYFENALAEGKNRITAFLTIIDLERQLAERRGDVAPDYPDEVLMAACGAVEASAQAGQSNDEQIAAGFAVIRARLSDEPEAQATH